MKNLIVIAATALTLGACSNQNKTDMADNPFLAPYDTKYEIPPFDKIEYGHYLAALDSGINQKKAQIAEITSNPDSATFDNTIMPLEHSGEILDRVATVFLDRKSVV